VKTSKDSNILGFLNEFSLSSNETAAALKTDAATGLQLLHLWLLRGALLRFYLLRFAQHACFASMTPLHGTNKGSPNNLLLVAYV
jgi:hypothetical protein